MQAHRPSPTLRDALINRSSRAAENQLVRSVREANKVTNRHNQPTPHPRPCPPANPTTCAEPMQNKQSPTPFKPAVGPRKEGCWWGASRVPQVLRAKEDTVRQSRRLRRGSAPSRQPIGRPYQRASSPPPGGGKAPAAKRTGGAAAVPAFTPMGGRSSPRNQGVSGDSLPRSGPGWKAQAEAARTKPPTALAPAEHPEPKRSIQQRQEPEAPASP